MLEIVSVEPDTPRVEEARALFAAYREFLETIESTHCFDFPRYQQEIAALPLPYTGAGGELLLACVDGTPAGCIAYRTATNEPPGTCEIKRLYVQPAFRAHGIANTLIADALQRAAPNGFKRAVLDTDIVSMPSAYAAYIRAGFTEYPPPHRPNPPSLRFLERELALKSAQRQPYRSRDHRDRNLLQRAVDRSVRPADFDTRPQVR